MDAPFSAPPFQAVLHLALIDLRSTVVQETAFTAGVLLTIAGVWLQWHLPRRRMSLEEELKDGRITERAAGLRLQLERVSARALTVVGALMMTAAVWVWIEF